MSIVTRRTWKWSLASLGLLLLAVAGVAFILWVVRLDRQILAEFGGRRWTEPTRVYAQSRELVAGTRLGLRQLVSELEQMRYRQVQRLPRPGEYQLRNNELILYTRRAQSIAGTREPLIARLRFGDNSIEALLTLAGEPLQRLRLDPPLIGSLFPIHGEDRLILSPDEVPRMLAAGIKAIEDRDFDHHAGVDYSAIARALWANLRAGEVEQGGSTLTQQLVKSYFLDGRRTLRRKITEAIMAQRLEAHYDKREIMTAYVNEVYLGQDGARAVHGFGLASQFYFGRTLEELEPEQIALLVGMIRGPSLYDPRRNPDRARQRRDYVLATLKTQQVIDGASYDQAVQRPLTLATAYDNSGRTYYPAFLDLVRRQLGGRGFSSANASTGHSVFTTLDPRVQRLAEQALTTELNRLGKERANKKLRNGEKPAPLEGVVIVADPASGDVLALVGGRNTTLAGFNRALDARRPIGSLVKPFVYLTALESGRYNAASIIDDSPVIVRTTANRDWQPQNFDHLFHGSVPLVRALAESMNAAAVSVALDVGIDSVASRLMDFGLARQPASVPALALGAVEATPLEVAQLYAGLATGGVRNPLHGIAGLATRGAAAGARPANSDAASAFAFRSQRVAKFEDVYPLDRMLVTVMDQGTGRSSRAALPPSLVVAGKSGTSSDYRDSWFAGFSGSHVVVVWIGTDTNQPTGLTGSSGALAVWTRVMLGLETQSWQPTMPPGFEVRNIDSLGGELVSEPCAARAIAVVVPRGTPLPESYECGSWPGQRFDDEVWSDGGFDERARDPAGEPRMPPRSLGERLRNWWDRVIH
ncbi:MAG: penicillin-binding protein 1B [Proteobacteria bacterium]|nr:penicillin-binding protein 1B [Pseudomonadota bacterium]